MRQLLNGAAVSVLTPLGFLLFRDGLLLPSAVAGPLAIVTGGTAFYVLGGQVGLQRASLRLYRALHRRRSLQGTWEESPGVFMWGTYAALLLFTCAQIMAPESGARRQGTDRFRADGYATDMQAGADSTLTAVVATLASTGRHGLENTLAGTTTNTAVRAQHRSATASETTERDAPFCPLCRDWLTRFLAAIMAPDAERDI